MDDLLTKIKILKRKIDNLEYEIYSTSAKKEKSRINYNYYKFVVAKFEENLFELRVKDRVVSIVEYSKIAREYDYALTSLKKYKGEYEYYSEYIDRSNKKFNEMFMEYENISKILNNRKVILLFRKKDE